ncbi:sensor histidine kinase (plasmid) [Streptomyces sp. HUAS TT11]|uniref:sensor histidine kinase n=1 Tax=Streptomyces sp. HUAS TT11 TaxID=3447508 RepID=UPI003F656134
MRLVGIADTHTARWRPRLALSLRWQVAALVAGVVCAVAVSLGVLVHQASERRGLSIGQERAGNALDEAAREAEAGTADSDGDPNLLDAAQLPAPLRRMLPDSRGTVFWYDDGKPHEPWMWAARRYGGQVLAVRVDVGSELRDLQALDRNLVRASGGILVAAVPVSVALTGLLTRRLRRVSSAARRIAHGERDTPIAATGRLRDEAAEIADSVDAMATALRRRLSDEQRFTADVAHELRTPLAGLVTSAELLPESKATGYVRDRVQVLRALVDDLLEVSRLDAGSEHAQLSPVPLGIFVEETVRRTGVAAELRIDTDAVVRTEPRRLERVLANLLLNADRHGGGLVAVTVTAERIEVRDHGPGFPAEMLRDGPRRFATGRPERGGGHGLGLTIALGQARVLGARLELANPPGGGAQATVWLPR